LLFLVHLDVHKLTLIASLTDTMMQTYGAGSHLTLLDQRGSMENMVRKNVQEDMDHGIIAGSFSMHHYGSLLW